MNCCFKTKAVEPYVGPSSTGGILVTQSESSSIGNNGSNSPSNNLSITLEETSSENLDKITCKNRTYKLSDTSWDNWVCHPQGGAKPSSFRLQVTEI